MRAFAYLALAAALVVHAGCSVPKAADLKPSNLFSMKSTWPWRDKDMPRTGKPVRIVSTWTDTVMHTAGQKPQRGFGGRVVFYDSDGKEPILVDGQFVVYAFDETAREPLDNKPTRRYVFPADQVPLHMSKTELGASYSFWLPWDEAGGPRTEVSLICRFEPKGGPVVTSEQTRQLLPGTLPTGSMLAREPARLPEGVPHRPALPTLESLRNARRTAGDGGAQLANFESTADPHTANTAHHVEAAPGTPERRMSVTSITLPHSMQVRGAGTTGGAGGWGLGTGEEKSPLQSTAPSPQPPAPIRAATNRDVGQARPDTRTSQHTSQAKPDPHAGFATWPIARPQFMTTQPTMWQPMSAQPSSVAAGAPNTAPTGQSTVPQQAHQSAPQPPMPLHR